MAVKEFPSRAILNSNLERINELLDIDKEDYEPISPEVTRERILSRIKEQNEIIIPRLISQGKLTPEWKRYIRKTLITTQ